MSEIETNEGVLQLGGTDSAVHSTGSGTTVGFETIQANSDGNCVNSTGKFRYMADRQLLDMPLDVSSLNLDCVAGTTDKLLKDLTVPQRTILYLSLHAEQSFKTVGKSLDVWVFFVEESVHAHGASLLPNLGCPGSDRDRLKQG
jgi:hypothetical protein